MEREPVESSNVAAIGYDEADQTLEIEYRNGGVYQYLDVPAVMHKDLMRSRSIGGFLHSTIRPNFECVKIG